MTTVMTPASATLTDRVARRTVRRALAACALVFGALDLIAAAGSHGRGTFLGAGWLIEAVIGRRYGLLLAGVVLVVVSPGLLRGKQNAWRIALGAGLVSVLGYHRGDIDTVGFVAGLTFLVLVACTRRQFVTRSDPVLARRGLQTLLLGESAVFVYGVAGMYLFDRDFRTTDTLVGSAKESFRLVLLLPVTTIEPVTRHGQWFIDSVRVAGLFVLLAGVARLVASVVHAEHRTGRHTVERILHSWGHGSLSPFTLLDDKNWLIGGDEQAFIAYKVVGATAVALGEPIGPPASCRRVLDEFLDLCESNGWTPAFHQVTGLGGEQLVQAGLKLWKIGEEAIVDVQAWSTDGSEHKSLRSALRRIERSGLVLEELPVPIDDASMAELRAVSDSWMVGGRRERTFTVGRFDPDALRETVVLVLREPDSARIVAFVNVLPSFQSSVGNFDLMRRRGDAPNGVMDYLFVALIDRFRAEGRTGMTLGLAPFANTTGDSIVDRAIRILYERGDELFHYRGLRRFKEKWSPRWEDRFLAYRRDADLPQIATAVARAGELPAGSGVRRRICRLARRLPVSLAILGVTIWLMLATAADPGLYPRLMRHFGLGWHDLPRLQLWRFPTSQLLQSHPGFVWANVALTFIALPLAEIRVGSRKALITFFLCDWVSTLLVLVAMKVAALLGSQQASAIIAARDSGPSAGAWALAIVAACSFSNRTARRTVVAVLFAFLTAALVAHHRLFDLQHMIAAIAGLVGALVPGRKPARLLGARAARRVAAGSAAVQETGAGRSPVRSVPRLTRTARGTPNGTNPFRTRVQLRRGRNSADNRRSSSARTTPSLTARTPPIAQSPPPPAGEDAAIRPPPSRDPRRSDSRS